MAIQQLASGNSSGIMNFLCQDDGSTDGMVLEGAEFAKTLHQLLGEYESDDAAETPENAETTTVTTASPAKEASAKGLAEVAGKTPLSTELDALTTDFALPAKGAALPAEAACESEAEGQEVEQPFWGIAPFTDVMAALKQHTNALAGSTTEVETPATTASAMAANDPANAAPAALFSSGIQQVIELARDVSQASTQLTQHPALPARNPGRNASAGGKTLPLAFRPAANTLNQGIASLQARAAQTTAMTEAQPFATADTTTLIPDLMGAEPRNPQAAPPAAPTLLQGMHALRADNPLLNHAKSPATDTTATGPALQLQSQHIAGTDAWLEDLGTRVDWLKDMNVQKADLQLHPAELGLLEIHISAGDDATTVSFVTHNAAAREMIEANMPRLRELLASQGMQLGQSNVSQHSSEGQRRQDTNAAAFAAQRDNGTAEEPAPIRRTAYMADPSRIDHYV